jgi:hypothetical protein
MGLAASLPTTGAPQARALGYGLSSRLEQWCRSEDKALPGSLLEVLQVPEDPFWSWHWTWRSQRLARPSPLLGGSRASELAMNAILPWLWVRAVEGHNEKMQEEVERRYFSWPAMEDNAILRLAAARLFGNRRHRFKSAAEQQGLLQVVRDFCENSNAICEKCPFPALVEGCV